MYARPQHKFMRHVFGGSAVMRRFAACVSLTATLAPSPMLRPAMTVWTRRCHILTDTQDRHDESNRRTMHKVSPHDEREFIAALLGAAFDANIVFLSDDRDLLDVLVEHGLSIDSRALRSRSVHMSEEQYDRLLVIRSFVFKLREVFVGKAAKRELLYVIPPKVVEEGTQAAMLRQSDLLPQNTLATAQRRWNGIARRLLYMCAYWAEGKRAPLEAPALFKGMETNMFDTSFRQLSQDLVLIKGGCNIKRVLFKRLEDHADVPKLHDGRSFFPVALPFITTATTGQDLIRRNVAMQRIVDIDYFPATRGSSAKGEESPTPYTTVAFSGETGSGKTVVALHGACTTPDAVAIYVTADQLNLGAGERAGGEDTNVDSNGMEKKAVAALEAFLQRNWPVERRSDRNVAVIVIDELGGYPHVARALCKCGVHDRLAAVLMISSVHLYLVGTGIDHVLAHSGARPSSYLHVRTHMFVDLVGEYARTSKLWAMVRLYLGAKQLSGVFGKLLRLSANARMGALLRECEQLELVGDPSSVHDKFARQDVAEVQTTLAAACASVLSAALARVKQYNGFKEHTTLEAMTEFGAAFAIACSNTDQELTGQGALNLSQRYGLVTDNVELMTKAAFDMTQVSLGIRGATPSHMRRNVAADAAAGGAPRSNDVTAIPADATHRFTMTAATAELAASGFGLTLHQTGWDAFEGMFASLMALHAFSAMCAAARGIVLAPVPQTPSDPLAPIKQWLRERAKTACSVEEVTLNESEAVLTQVDARSRIVEIAKRSRDVRGAALAGLVSKEHAGLFNNATQASRLNAGSGLRELGGLRADLVTLGRKLNDPDTQAKAATFLVQMTMDELSQRRDDVVLVVARNAPRAPFADVIVGLARRATGSDVWQVDDTDLLLVQVKCHSSVATTLSCMDEQLELYKMGCRSDNAVVAQCCERIAAKGDAYWRLERDHMVDAISKAHDKKKGRSSPPLDLGTLDDDSTATDWYKILVKYSARPRGANESLVVAAGQHGLLGLGDSTTARCAHEILKYRRTPTGPAKERVKALLGGSDVTAREYNSINKRLRSASSPADVESVFTTHVVGKQHRGKAMASPGAIAMYVVLWQNVTTSEDGARPDNVLVVTNGVAAGAFYPTSWGNNNFFNDTYASRRAHLK